MDIAYLNGQFLPLSDAKISVMDRGFLFGDGIYEVIPVFGGKIFRLAQHLTRLENSLEAIKIPNPMSAEQWQAMLEQLIAQTREKNLGIYLQITRGAVSKRDHAFPKAPQPTVFAMANPVPDSKPVNQVQGIKTVTVEDIRWHRCDIKSIALLGNTMLKQLAIEQGADEAILIRDGKATEGAASNLFIVNGAGQIVTPPLSNNLLGGITRDLIVELCQHEGLDCIEAQVTADDLKVAQEIWMTSSTKEIMPVLENDGRPVGDGKPGPVWEKAYRIYLSFKDSVTRG